jgi:hypothetical protein
MPSDPRKRQRKLERRASKRKHKKHQLVKEMQGALGRQLTAATKFPPLDTLINETVWTEGLGWVLFSRELPNGSIAVALFLVDRYCLGVKNALATIVGRFIYQSDFMRKIRAGFPCREVSPATVRKLVEEAVAYAHDLGFQPHADYDKAKLLFGDVDPSESTEQFEFGKDGMPLFISGPNDTPERCRQILKTLADTRGPDQSNFVIQGAPGQHIGFDDEEDGELDDDGP